MLSLKALRGNRTMRAVGAAVFPILSEAFMADVFLMGTSGKFDDPQRSKWRDPIKAACAKAGITCFDPVVPEGNDAAMKAEIEALRTSHVIVMPVTSDPAVIPPPPQHGWAPLSAT